MREMKDSGIEWIDEIPLDWTAKPLKWMVKFGKGLPITKDNLIEQGIPVVSYGQIHSKTNDGTHLRDDLIRFVSEAYLESNPLSLGKKGDIFFADTSEDYAGIGNAVLVDIDTPVFAGYHTVIVRPDDQSYSRYLAYLFLTDAWRSQLCSEASGIKVFSITQGLLKKTTVILPPAEKAAAMTDYLDRKCSQIDAIIARQQEVIEKLKAYKLSVITEAVTKGLNPDVPMKDSGVEWIGKIPEHWKVMKFGRCAMVKSNLVNPDDYADYPQISPDSIEKNSGRIFEYKTVKESGVISWNHLFFQGQIIYSKIRPMLNKVAIAPFDGLCSADMYPIETSNNAQFLVYMMLSDCFTSQVGLVTENRVKMPKINQNELNAIMVVIPPRSEQEIISKYLQKECFLIDARIDRKQKLVGKLIDYKKSLIYEVVTGKKEV